MNKEEQKPCPVCLTPMDFDDGDLGSREDPPQPGFWFCEECGYEDYDDPPPTFPDPPEANFDFDWPQDDLPF